eukprot:CAMPEP_0114156464 /NCGR_PEP_ID=MMETSP0043_2-20121206/26065_1 /TAXON_ID=464988 /ORGANISM="Hemiselmis andersenii, Strain CCMP644" /LENGTH=84 /DNA_ID=CAMNT_0001251893 /DNA_START=118 /DNA_END=369 /DNA_ORIENTATION=+
MSVHMVGRHGLMLPPSADEQVHASSAAANVAIDGGNSLQGKISRSRAAMMQSALKPLPPDGDSMASTPSNKGAGVKKKGILAAQ